MTIGCGALSIEEHFPKLFHVVEPLQSISSTLIQSLGEMSQIPVINLLKTTERPQRNSVCEEGQLVSQHRKIPFWKNQPVVGENIIMVVEGENMAGGGILVVNVHR